MKYRANTWYEKNAITHHWRARVHLIGPSGLSSNQIHDTHSLLAETRWGLRREIKKAIKRYESKGHDGESYVIET